MYVPTRVATCIYPRGWQHVCTHEGGNMYVLTRHFCIAPDSGRGCSIFFGCSFFSMDSTLFRCRGTPVWNQIVVLFNQGVGVGECSQWSDICE